MQPLNYSVMNFLTSSLSDVLIPCAICLVESVGKRPDQWRQAVMKEAHLKTLQHRFRQHMQRKHGLGTRHEQGFAIRELGKRLLCSCLHATEPASGVGFS